MHNNTIYNVQNIRIYQHMSCCLPIYRKRQKLSLHQRQKYSSSQVQLYNLSCAFQGQFSLTNLRKKLQLSNYSVFRNKSDRFQSMQNLSVHCRVNAETSQSIFMYTLPHPVRKDTRKRSGGCYISLSIVYRQFRLSNVAIKGRIVCSIQRSHKYTPMMMLGNSAAPPRNLNHSRRYQLVKKLIVRTNNTFDTRIKKKK